jgi:murein DD-endopeptidase MepM/ murein hydrolase activator NlpD
MPAVLCCYSRDFDVICIRSSLACGQGIASAARVLLPFKRKTLPGVVAFAAVCIGTTAAIQGTPAKAAVSSARDPVTVVSLSRLAEQLSMPNAQPVTSSDAVRRSLRDDDGVCASSVALVAGETAVRRVSGTVCGLLASMRVPLANARSGDGHRWYGQVTMSRGAGLSVPSAATPLGTANGFAMQADQGASAAGSIDTTLRESLARAGLAPDVARQIGQIFAGRIDIDARAQAGDTYRILLDPLPRSKGAQIASIEVRMKGRTYNAVRFTAPGAARSAYYTLDGTLLAGKPFTMPLDFRRVSSPFGMRMHPVYGEARFHEGVDLTAAVGTPIYAAAGGTVAMATRGHGYGNRVVLRHSDGYSTCYAHLAGYASGLKAGQRVAQGQLIGYVGSTGASTGPHLHFEVRRNDRPIDPLTLTSREFVSPLSGAARVAFAARATAARTSLAALQSSSLRVVSADSSSQPG